MWTQGLWEISLFQMIIFSLFFLVLFSTVSSLAWLLHRCKNYSLKQENLLSLCRLKNGSISHFVLGKVQGPLPTPLTLGPAFSSTLTVAVWTHFPKHSSLLQDVGKSSCTWFSWNSGLPLICQAVSSSRITFVMFSQFKMVAAFFMHYRSLCLPTITELFTLCSIYAYIIFSPRLCCELLENIPISFYLCIHSNKIRHHTIIAQ